MQNESKQQILERRKEVEQKLVGDVQGDLGVLEAKFWSN